MMFDQYTFVADETQTKNFSQPSKIVLDTQLAKCDHVYIETAPKGARRTKMTTQPSTITTDTQATALPIMSRTRLTSLTETSRSTLRSRIPELRSRYAEGEKIKDLAAEIGKSYEWTWQLVRNREYRYTCPKCAAHVTSKGATCDYCKATDGAVIEVVIS